MNEIQLTDHLVAHIGAEGTCGRYQAKIYEDGNFRDFLTSKNTMMAIVQAFCLLVFSWTHRLAVEPSDLEHHRLSGAYQL